jgi:hypothetical protein
MPGITPPDSTGTGASYTVELNNIHIGTLTVSGGTASVYISEPMPGFMQVVRIWLVPGGYVYDNGPTPGVNLAPGTYQVYATLRVVPRSDVYGSAADLTLRCGGSPTATITLRVPNPNEWGLRADIYTFTPTWPNPPPWPPFEGPAYTYRGTWSVGAIYIWLEELIDYIGLPSPYFTSVYDIEIAPKWAAYWIDPTATQWVNWAVRLTGRLYVPWSDIRVGVWQNKGTYVRLCSIDTGNSWWTLFHHQIDVANGICTGAPGEYSIEIGHYQDDIYAMLIFVIGPGGSNEAYIPTIDGALYCPDFDWSPGVIYGELGRCNVRWSFRPASAGVPHFVGTNYTPGSADGGGEPLP